LKKLQPILLGGIAIVAIGSAFSFLMTIQVFTVGPKPSPIFAYTITTLAAAIFCLSIAVAILAWFMPSFSRPRIQAHAERMRRLYGPLGFLIVANGTALIWIIRIGSVIAALFSLFLFRLSSSGI
jgi:hypothetical protein